MAHAASTIIGRARVPARRAGDGLVTPVLFAIVVLVSTFLFYTWSRIEAVRIGYEIFNANAEMRKLDQENKELILEIATLKSHKRIERVARGELGLIPPQEDQIIILR